MLKTVVKHQLERYIPRAFFIVCVPLGNDVIFVSHYGRGKNSINSCSSVIVIHASYRGHSQDYEKQSGAQ